MVSFSVWPSDYLTHIHWWHSALIRCLVNVIIKCCGNSPIFRRKNIITVCYCYFDILYGGLNKTVASFKQNAIPRSAKLPAGRGIDEGTNRRQWPVTRARHRTDIILAMIANEKCYMFIQIRLRFVLEDQIDNKSALLQVMAWRQPGQSEPRCSVRNRCQCRYNTGLKLENYYFFTFSFSRPEVGKLFRIYVFTFSRPEVGKLFHVSMEKSRSRKKKEK